MQIKSINQSKGTGTEYSSLIQKLYCITCTVLGQLWRLEILTRVRSDVLKASECLTFTGPDAHRNFTFYSKTNKMHQSVKFILFWNDTLHHSIVNTNTCTTSMSQFKIY